MKKSKKLVLAAFVCVVLLLSTVISVSADLGPKPEIWIKLENAPAKYYMDLLVDYDGEYKNLYEEEIKSFDENMWNALSAYTDNGWYPALAHGTNVPLFGTIVPGENNESVFSYWGVPDRFRVIVVDGDGNVKTSGIIEKKYYQEHISLDYNSMRQTGSYEEYTQEVERNS